MLGVGIGINKLNAPLAGGGGGGYLSEKHLAFDGIDQYGEISAADSFINAVGTTGGTISAWVRSSDLVPPNNGSSYYVFGGFSGIYPVFNYFAISFQRYANTDLVLLTRRKLHLTDPSQNLIWHSERTDPISVSDNTWYHIAFVAKPSGGSWVTAFYLDGSEVATNTADSPTATDTDSYYDSTMPFTVAKYSTVYDAFDVNEIGVWSSELTAPEIAEIYNNGVSGFDLSSDKGDYVSSSDLYSWHKMGDETSGSTEPDSSGNGRDMTLYNSPSIETT